MNVKEYQIIEKICYSEATKVNFSELQMLVLALQSTERDSFAMFAKWACIYHANKKETNNKKREQ